MIAVKFAKIDAVPSQYFYPELFMVKKQWKKYKFTQKIRDGAEKLKHVAVSSVAVDYSFLSCTIRFCSVET